MVQSSGVGFDSKLKVPIRSLKPRDCAKTPAQAALAAAASEVGDPVQRLRAAAALKAEGLAKHERDALEGARVESGGVHGATQRGKGEGDVGG